MLTREQQDRADETLATILGAAAGPAPAPVVPLTTRPRRRLGRGLLLVAAALALTLVISMSGLFGGGTAYASWTARPTQLPLAQQEELAQKCRDHLTEGSEAPAPPGIPTAADLQAAGLVVADTRGDWTYVVLSGDQGLEATCLIQDGRFLGIIPRTGTSAGSYGFMEGLPTPAADTIIGTGLMSMSSDEGSAWSTEGYIGSDVAAVTILTPAGTRVQATLTGDRFAAWWPQRETIHDAGGLAQVTYLITLKDGTELPPTDYDAIAPPPHE